jgi:hypothetical protein
MNDSLNVKISIHNTAVHSHYCHVLITVHSLNIQACDLLNFLCDGWTTAECMKHITTVIKVAMPIFACISAAYPEYFMHLLPEVVL